MIAKKRRRVKRTGLAVKARVGQPLETRRRLAEIYDDQTKAADDRTPNVAAACLRHLSPDEPSKNKQLFTSLYRGGRHDHRNATATPGAVRRCPKKCVFRFLFETRSPTDGC